MNQIKQHVDQYLAGEDTDLSSAMFSAYRPAIESYYSGLNLNYTSPEEDHPILGGRPMEGDLQGIIIAIEKTDWEAPVGHDSLTTIQQHVMEFLISAQEEKAFTLGSEGLNDLHRQFT